MARSRNRWLDAQKNDPKAVVIAAVQAHRGGQPRNRQSVAPTQTPRSLRGVLLCSQAEQASQPDHRQGDKGEDKFEIVGCGLPAPLKIEEASTVAAHDAHAKARHRLKGPLFGGNDA